MRNILVKKSITTSAAAYTAGDLIGTGGLIKIPGISMPGGACRIVSAMLVDAIKQNKANDLIIFSEIPGSTSVFTDNTAIDVKAVDFDKVCGILVFATGAAYKDLGTISAQTLNNQQMVVKAAKNRLAYSQDLYCALVAREAPTYGAATVLELVLGLEQL